MPAERAAVNPPLSLSRAIRPAPRPAAGEAHGGAPPSATGYGMAKVVARFSGAPELVRDEPASRRGDTGRREHRPAGAVSLAAFSRAGGEYDRAEPTTADGTPPAGLPRAEEKVGGREKNQPAAAVAVSGASRGLAVRTIASPSGAKLTSSPQVRASRPVK